MIHAFSSLLVLLTSNTVHSPISPVAKVGNGGLPVVGQEAKKYTLSRKYTANEKLVYQVRGVLNAEEMQYPLRTFIPEDIEINYRFTILVKQLKADGIAAINYKRPVMNFIEGETMESEPKTTVEKIDDNLDVDASPVNEILELVDLNADKKKKKAEEEKRKKEKSGDGLLVRSMRPTQTRGDIGAIILLGQYQQEIQRLALCIGSLDSGLDFAPRFSLDQVKVGDTWKKTVSYTPQKLKDEGNKQAVQRLDYTYTFKGPMTDAKGKSVIRISATLATKSDMVDFATQLTDEKKGAGLVRKAPLSIDAQIDFDLDPDSFHTVRAVATSVGGSSLNLRGFDGNYLENRFKGKTTLVLESRTIVAPASTKTPVKPPVKPPVKKKPGR